MGLVSGQLLTLRTSLDSSGFGSTGNVTVIVTATGGTATATGGAATATGGSNTNNDNDTNTATNNGRSDKSKVGRMMRKILRLLQRIPVIFKGPIDQDKDEVIDIINHPLFW